MLTISHTLQVPLDVMTLATAVLANRGAGKTYFASVLAEELLAAGQQVVIIDPVGVLWGLKSGYAIPVFGGDHADVALQPSAGEALAKAVVEHGFSAIFDTSEMTNSDALRFVGDFLHELYRKNRTPCYVIIDEADMFAPQGATSGNAPKCLGAMQHLVRRGRARGLGCALITQRPQAIAKDVLTQCEVLVALRMSHPRDIDAVKEWVDTQASSAESKEVVQSLPSLPTGEAWFWAPSLKLFQRAKVRTRQTFDSSATPKPGQARSAPKHLEAVDLAKLGAQIAATVEEQKANDPAALKARIRELERQVRERPGDDAQIVDLKETIASKERWALGVAAAADSRKNAMFAAANKLSEIILDLRLAAVTEDFASQLKTPPVLVQSFNHESRRTHPKSVRDSNRASSNGYSSDISLRAGARRMLATLCQWSPAGRTEAQLAAQVQMKRTGGTWGTYKSDLKNAGFLEIRNGLWFSTDAAQEFLGVNAPATPATTEEVVRLWGDKLRKGAREMLDALVNQRGHAIPREELGRLVGMEPTGGTFGTYLSDLKQAGLILTDGSGVRADADALLLNARSR